MPQIYSQADRGQSCSAAVNLEVYSGDHDLLRLLHFASGGSEWRTNCLSGYSIRKILQPKISVNNRYCGMPTYPKLLQTSGKLIIMCSCS